MPHFNAAQGFSESFGPVDFFSRGQHDERFYADIDPCVAIARAGPMIDRRGHLDLNRDTLLDSSARHLGT